jgi:hypothetical protein
MDLEGLLVKHLLTSNNNAPLHAELVGAFLGPPFNTTIKTGS